MANKPKSCQLTDGCGPTKTGRELILDYHLHLTTMAA